MKRGLMKRRFILLGGNLSLMSILCCLSIAVYTCGCDDNTIVEKAPGFVGGIVMDSISSEPIYQAWVSHDSLFDTLDVLTDTSGYYVMNAGFPGIHRWLYCGKSGYLAQAKEYSVSSDDTTRLDFELVGESIGLPVNE